MSFILDALKRSENERQRQTGPGLAGAPEGVQGQRKSPWLAIVIGLLALNLAVLAGMLLRAGDEDPPEPVRTMAEPGSTPMAAERSVATTHTRGPAAAEVDPATSAAAPTLDSRGARGEIRSLRDEIRVEESPDVSEPTATTAGSGTGAVAVTRDRPSRANPTGASPATAPQAAPTGTAGPQATALPTVQDMTLRGEFSGRPLHLDLHVYYDEPSRRLVFINGVKYREGERIGDGLRVAEIAPDGAILDDGRQRFLLPSN